MNNTIHNTTLIKLVDGLNDNMMIRAFYTEKPEEFLKQYLLMQKYEIPFDTYFDRDDSPSKYNYKECYIKDFNITFGGQVTIPCIEVYVEII